MTDETRTIHLCPEGWERYDEMVINPHRSCINRDRLQSIRVDKYLDHMNFCDICTVDPKFD